jgi:serine protease Do
MNRILIVTIGVVLCGAGLLPTARPWAAVGAAESESINLRRTVTVEVVQKAKGSVVNISTTKLIARRRLPRGFDPFWEGSDVGDIVRVPADSLGSGFVVHEDGYVVTNHHVIDRARQIKVELADGRKLDADLVSSDPEADLAVLRIQGEKPLTPLELGDSADLMIGEPVIAVGNPMGFSHSVSTGIVSALHRDLKSPDGSVLLTDLVQTDAAINPGNSGGPLLNAYGQVIGINTAIRGDAQNIGFSIPVNRLRDLVPELMNPSQVTKVDVHVSLAERRSVTAPAGVSSELVLNGDGPQSRTVRSINGRRPRDIVDAYATLLRVRANENCSIVCGDGAALRVKATQVPLPDAIVQARERLGMTIEQLSPLRAERYGLGVEEGLLITEVRRGGVAGQAGLKPGDVLVQLGRHRVSTLDDFSALMARFPETGRARAYVIREGHVGYTVLEW